MRREGSLRSRPARRGRLSFASFSLAKQRKGSAPSARDAWLKLRSKPTTAVTLFQAAFGERGKVCKRRAQRGCTPYGCGCHQLCGEANSKCRRAADAPFLVFRLPLVGGKFVGRAFMPDKHKPVYLYRYITIIVVPIKSYTRRRVADSTNSTARRADAV